MTGSLPILTFHALEDQPSVLSFSPRLFRRGLGRLHESGYRTLSLLEALDYRSKGTSFPDRSVVLTFDDGYQTVYHEAFPVLYHFGMSATVFLTVGERGMGQSTHRPPALNGRTMLAWEEIREMQRSGISFGAHTLTHPDLRRMPVGRIEREVLESKATIEDALGAPVSSFAYPFGGYDERCLEIVRRHFACACSDRLGLFTVESDFHAIERVDAHYIRGERLFAMLLTRLFPPYIRMRSVPRRIRRTIQHGKRFS